MFVVKVLGSGCLLSVLVIGSNHYYVNKTWRSTHGIILEALELAAKDQTVVDKLGIPLIRKGEVAGVLEPDKNWSNVNFEVHGPRGQGKMILLAECGDPAFPLAVAARPLSTIENLFSYFSAAQQSEETHWKITTMQMKFDGVLTHQLISSTLRTHEALRQAESIELPSETEVAPAPVSNVERRKRQNFKRMQTRWKYLAGAGGAVAVLWWFSRKLLLRRPAGKSLFINNALDILRADLAVRRQIGYPISHLQNIKGSLNYSLTKGRAATIVYGHLGYAQFSVAGHYDKKQQQWVYTVLRLNKDGEEYSLIT